ncbi:sodium/glucose cotransporter 4 [Aplysia californica]|uniref:Sodium/glucose cotransporter 4 n=1 Tax=Aplysia californica TaxID=6500 RepID=A0ABM1A984_APLCA|nr:sodium/glucose cotransporter 4 [Aplysia californica]
MTWIPVGASIFASNVGAPMFIGLAGTAAASGFAVTIYEWHAVYLLIALGWVFMPVYIASGAFTLPEYLTKRFGGARLRILFSLLSLAIYVILKISSEIYAGVIFLQQLLGWNLYVCTGAILLVTAVYTTVGGMAAVMYTDTLQTAVLIVGAAILSVISMVEVGGWNSFMAQYSHAAPKLTLNDPLNYSCGMPRSDFMHIWRDPETGDIPWTGVIFGLIFNGVCVWCTDQINVQRCLSAKNISHAKGGTTFAAGLKLLPFVLWIVPGMISRVLYPDEVACADPESCERACSNKQGCTNIAYPLLVLRMLPTGLRGLMLAALLAALMSTLTSALNSSSSTFTLDIWRRIRRGASQRELMIVGRLCIIVVVIFSVVWIPIIEKSQGGQLWTYLQTVSACVSPPWCWVFLLAIFWTRTTEKGAFWGLVVGTAVGLVRMSLEFAYPAPPCGSTEVDKRPAILAKVHFLHFSAILSALSIIVTVAVSLLTNPHPTEKLRRVTWWTRHEEAQPLDSESEDELRCVEEEEDEEEEAPDMLKTVVAEPKPKTPRRVYNWVCGLSDAPEPRLSKQEKLLLRQKMTDITEDKNGRAVCIVAGVVVAGITTFLLGYFH